MSPPQGPCGTFDGAELANVEAQVKKDFLVATKPGRVFVDFGCDHALGAPSEVVLEDGSDVGGSLRIVRFRVDGQRVGVRIYDSSPSAVRVGETTLARLKGLLASSRVALLAKPHVVALTSSVVTRAAWSSTNQTHRLLRIADREGRVTERGFTGYASSATQERALPVRMATDPFAKLVSALTVVVTDATDDDRAFFTERFLATTSAEEPPAAWVSERYVALATTLGTLDAVPTLVALAQRTGEAPSLRSREAALVALAAITGWDPQKDGAGTRGVEEAARLVAEACTPAPDLLLAPMPVA